MKSIQEKISISISRKEGVELRNQIISLTNGTSDLYMGELRGTPIAELYELLTGNFESRTKGVNFTSGHQGIRHEQ